jgi:hypothetical protein
MGTFEAVRDADISLQGHALDRMQRNERAKPVA